MKALRFKHIFGEAIREKYENVTPTNITCESQLIKANSKYVSFIYHSGGGGKLAILENGKQRKISAVQPMLLGHQGQILDLDFDPFDDDFIATSSMDCSIKIWQIP